MNEGIDLYVFLHEDTDGTISQRSFSDKYCIEDVIKEFTYFLKGVGFSDESIENYIPYFDV